MKPNTTAVERIIEDCIKGGWMNNLNREKLVGVSHFSERMGRLPVVVVVAEDGWKIRLNVAEILLDPLAWQAVSKVRGWVDYHDSILKDEEWANWRVKWHDFIDNLADGETIEEALLAIE